MTFWRRRESEIGELVSALLRRETRIGEDGVLSGSQRAKLLQELTILAVHLGNVVQ